MPDFGSEFHIACMRSERSSFEAAGRGSRARHQNPTRAQYTSYPANKQAKEEVACAGLNRSLGQSLQHLGVHYPAER
ncbi:hypothetical protein TNCV_3763291 [Trichonephila clavipes]|uniref:Uncharacterized protein n=1 Tax=Trichonephila clavipes TaxID=2585209 RepID=A0A8X7B9I9_TRICX|nr:hypothetical protein TNCV_3763291 [Trichonephila clavipes]